MDPPNVIDPCEHAVYRRSPGAAKGSVRQIEKPRPGEFPAYAAMYIDLLPDDGLVLQHLRESFEVVKALALALPEEKLSHRYAAGKWTIPEILVHIVDDERIYSYRALRFARGDRTELPGFEQDGYTATSRAGERDLASIFEEYEAVRRSTVALFGGLPGEAFERTGVADGSRMSVRAIAYHIAGHEAHHLSVLQLRHL